MTPDRKSQFPNHRSPDDYRQTPFLAILAYVLGFLLILAMVAFAGAWLLRLLAR